MTRILMSESNNLPQAISHKKLSNLLNKAQKDIYSFVENDQKNIDKEELLKALSNFEVCSNNIINQISECNDKKLLNDHPSKSIMALGAMEAHLNMALQALKAFRNSQEE